MTYLPDDILTKVDRATMAASLESRVPFLDPHVAAFVVAAPARAEGPGGQRANGSCGRLLHRYVPPELVERPKAGFGIPLGDWLRGPLRAWAEELLDARRIEGDGYLAADPVRRLWREHQSGRYDRRVRVMGRAHAPGLAGRQRAVTVPLQGRTDDVPRHLFFGLRCRVGSGPTSSHGNVGGEPLGDTGMPGARAGTAGRAHVLGR